MAQYIGVGNVARNVINRYIGVSNVARKVINGYIGVSGVARRFTEKYLINACWFNCGTPPSDYVNSNGTIEIRGTNYTGWCIKMSSGVYCSNSDGEYGGIGMCIDSEEFGGQSISLVFSQNTGESPIGMGVFVLNENVSLNSTNSRPWQSNIAKWNGIGGTTVNRSLSGTIPSGTKRIFVGVQNSDRYTETATSSACITSLKIGNDTII